MCWTENLADVYGAVMMRRTLARFLRQAYPVGNDPESFYASELIIGELLSNVVRYTPGSLCIEVNDVNGRVELIMHDAGRGIEWNPVLPKDDDAERGRGMFIVSALAAGIRSWSDGNGSRVSVILPLIAQKTPFTRRACPLERAAADPSICSKPRAMLSAPMR